MFSRNKPSTIKWWSKYLLFALCVIPLNLSAQKQPVRCFTMEADSIMHSEHPRLESLDDFEHQLQKHIQSAHKNHRFQGDVYLIPVVVHVVHNGESIGTGRNISMAQIQSQIDVLNEDYRRKSGTPGYNSNTNGCDTKIEFVLAKRNTSGASSNGVDRIDRNTMGWSAPPYNTSYIDATIKPGSSWNANEYFNLWVVDISGGILGYAQFPNYSSLAGFNCNEGNANTDGVVIDYQTFGSTDKGTFPVLTAPYDKGRTATHEVGHWLGLRHIWGDGACGVDDFCGDTPEAGAANYGCPTGTSSCSSTDMIENYMDYTDDACMNIFTKDQDTRMRTVLETCPRRLSLLTSPALSTPSADDAGIAAIINPSIDFCSASITPKVLLKNYGTANLSSALIKYKVDAGSISSYSWSGTALSTGDTVSVSLPIITVTSGTHTFNAWTANPNGNSDGNSSNDTAYQAAFEYTSGAATTWTENFDGKYFTPANFQVLNAGNDCFTWREISHIIGSTGSVTSAAFLYFYYYSSPSAQEDGLVTPAIDLTGSASATLTFDVAYARYDNSTSDGLKILVSSDCGATWSSPVYNKSGSTLKTVSNQTSSWFPSASGDWRNETVDLSSYIGNSIRLKFISVNDYGNNLFIDNLSLSATALLPVQLISLKAKQLNNGDHLIEWRSSDEIDLDAYLIEHSTDGIHFSLAGSVNAEKKYTHTNLHDYQFMDKNRGKNYVYYRLWQKDLDGGQYVLGTVKIKASDYLAFNIKVFPNPFTDQLNIRLDNRKNTHGSIRILNTLGQMILEKTWNGNDRTVSINTSTLAAGIYYVKIESGALNKVMPFVKE